MRLRMLRLTLGLVAAFQVFFGLALLLAPGRFAALLDLPPAPAWTSMIFALFGARALGFAYGMVVTMRDPERHRSWIIAMVAVQAIDWVAAMAAVASGAMSLAQVSTASFMPLLFIAGLVAFLPRGERAVAPAGHAQLHSA